MSGLGWSAVFTLMNRQLVVLALADASKWQHPSRTETTTCTLGVQPQLPMADVQHHSPLQILLMRMSSLTNAFRILVSILLVCPSRKAWVNERCMSHQHVT